MSNWSYKRMQRLILPRGSNYWCLKCTCVNKMFESLACIWQSALVTNNQSLHGDSYHFPENWKFNPILHLWKMTNSPPCQDRDQFSNKYSAPVIDLWIFYLWLPRFGFGLESAKKIAKNDETHFTACLVIHPTKWRADFSLALPHSPRQPIGTVVSVFN